MDQMVEYKPKHVTFWENELSQSTLEYVAGLFDAEGCIMANIDKKENISFRVTLSQAQKGVSILKFIYETFGGAVLKTTSETKTHQASYTWYLMNEYAKQFCILIHSYAILKKEQIQCGIEFPCENIHITPLEVYNRKTKTTKFFDTKKDVKEYLKYNFTWNEDEDDIYYNDFIIRKTLKKDQVLQIRNKRKELYERLVTLKSKEHYIPDDIKPSIEYIAGIFDGDGCIDTHGKSSQHHCVVQKYKALPDLLKRTFGGSVYLRKCNNTWCWEIYQFADDFLKAVQPYLIGKKEQADLVLNMKPGEAMEVHAKLSKLKGNYGGNKCLIEKIEKGINPKEFKLPAKELPRGVHMKIDKYSAILRHDNVQYTLGSFNTIEEASAKYREVRRAVDAMKNGGPVVDLSIYLRENKSNPAPPENIVLPKGVYLTKANTFQARSHHNGKTIQLGTHKTVDDAIKAIEDYNNNKNKNK